MMTVLKQSHFLVLSLWLHLPATATACFNAAESIGLNLAIIAE